ncbi:DUF4190 domain-containing protein [Actinotalea ferrariae]|uniref:DUF4190 domain-containing protein n=1 Tax=Actinotalea ferrariae TaxID=1386098 RepID=UPI00068AA1EE|nr:DUF4190 domain-containing protein [Actinotalea ferrariae]
MSNPTGPQDPYGQQGDGSSWQGQGGAHAGGDMGGGYSAPPPPPGYYGGSAGGPMYPGTEKNNLGVWALVLGIVGVVCCSFTAIPAIILGNKSKEAAAQGLANNGSFGQAGVILGWVGVALLLLGLVWVFALGGLAVISESTSGTTGY